MACRYDLPPPQRTLGQFGETTTDRLTTLMAAYDETIREHEVFGQIFGI
jgi:hypothetical protein